MKVSSSQAGPTRELQLQQQSQMISQLQKQMQALLEIHLQQQQQRFSNEEAMRRMQENIAQKSAVEEAERMQTQPVIDEIGIVSTDNSPPLPASDSMDGPESLSPSSLQLIRKRTEGSKVAINEEKQQVNDRVEICNVAAPKNSSDYVRQNSTMYSCKDCGKEFTHKGNMNKHLRIHTGEKPFKCQICQTSFNQKSSLSRHLLIHTNEKPFLCDICQRSFRHKWHLSNHMKIHSGLKPWKCNVCQKLFRQKSNLNRHRKLHTEDKE